MVKRYADSALVKMSTPSRPGASYHLYSILKLILWPATLDVFFKPLTIALDVIRTFVSVYVLSPGF